MKTSLRSDESIRGFPLFWTKLLQPVCETLDEAHSGQKILVSVIFHARHEQEPAELDSEASGIPAHEIGKSTKDELLVHDFPFLGGASVNRNPDRVDRRRRRRSRTA